MIEHAPLVGALGVQLARVRELQRAAEADHLGQVVRATVLDDLAGIVIGDEPRLFAADTDVAMQRHVHARTDCRTVDHRDRRLADQRDVTVQLGEPVEEMLARPVGPFCGARLPTKFSPVTSC